MGQGLLRVHGLRVSFLADREVPAVRGADLSIGTGESLGLLGESGSGKTATALAILGLVPPPGRVMAGSIALEGRELTALSPREFREVRGREIGMIFQEPMSSLNPVFTVGYQLGEALTAHFDLPRREVRTRCIALLREVGIPDPASRLNAYPSELSGGLRQRVMIAIAAACRPRLLIADEPTTALDVTIQAQVMALLRRLREEIGMALLLITHDLGLAAQNVERVAVMYAGHVVEEGKTRDLFARPLHPYTRGLLASMPGSPGIPRGGELRVIPGTVPHPLRVPAGCPFRTRCAMAVDLCGSALPPLEETEPGRSVRCVRVTAGA